MINLSFYLALLCFFNAQHKTPQLPSSLLEYYSNINLAQRAIFINDFVKASSYFDLAFQNNDTPFYIDLKSAIKTNHLSGLDEKNIALIDFVLSAKRPDTTSLFDDLGRSVFTSEQLYFIRHYYQNNPLNSAMQNDYLNLFLGHQNLYFKEDTNDIYLEHTTFSLSNKTKDSLSLQYIKSFLNLYEKYGFPTEEKLRLHRYDPKEVSWFVDENDFIWGDISFLLGKAMNSQYEDRIIPILDKALIDGHLPPQIYADIFEQKYIFQMTLPKILYYQSQPIIDAIGRHYRPFIVYNDSTMNIINENRCVIGLDSFHICQKQYIAARFCPKFEAQAMVRPYNFPSISMSNSDFDKVLNGGSFDESNSQLTKYQVNIYRYLTECGCAEKLYFK